MKCSVCFAAVSICLFAQQPIAFEVASVKQLAPGSLVTMIGGSPSGSRLTLEAMSLSDLVSWAYNLKPWQITGGPVWARSQKDRTTIDDATKRFNIAAKAEGDRPRSPEEFRRMLQSLLTHSETRNIPVYTLVADKNGPKFHESEPGSKGILRMNGGGKITASGGTMTQLVNWFSNANGVDRPVIDQTGLSSHYDFTLEWTNPLASMSTDLSAPSIFTAIREQLGLKLEPSRAPVEFMVIDRAEIPSEN